MDFTQSCAGGSFGLAVPHRPKLTKYPIFYVPKFCFRSRDLSLHEYE